MKYKKIMILAIFLVSLLAVSAVSAADNATSDVAGVEETNEKIVGVEENQIDLKENDVGTFTDLANEIANANNQLNLNRNYSYTSADSYYKYGITIDKSIVINGNGYTINGNNGSKAFQVNAVNVVLNNINFVNSYSDWEDNVGGAAVCWSGAGGVLANCSFVNSSSFESGGGAVCWSGTGGVLANCSFVKSSSSYGSGGAVCWSGTDGVLANCSFVDCFATYGGAVYWEGFNGVLANCSFVNSSSRYGGGGAVCWSGTGGVLANCSFVNSGSSEGSSGAVDWNGVNGTLYGCSFVNSGSTYSGGAVCWGGDNGNLSDCSFVNSSTGDEYGDGGAVYWYGANGVLANCSFVNSSSDWYDYADGGAVYWAGANGVLANCSFVNSSSYGSGAVYWAGANGTLFNCSFVKSSSSYGGAVYWSGTGGVIANCSFVNSSARYGNGGAVYWSGTGGVIANCSFYNNLARNVGNAIYMDSGVIYKCYFSPNFNSISGDFDNLEIIKIYSSSIVCENISFAYGDNANLSAYLNTCGQVIFNIFNEYTNKSFIVTTTNDGIATLHEGLNELDIGSWNVSVCFNGDDNYYPCNTTANVVVNKLDTILTIPDVATVYNTTGKVVATLKDVHGNVVSDVKVKIVVGDLTKTAKTNRNGQVSLDISSLGLGEYKVSARSSATSALYNEAKATAKAVVYANKLNTTLTIPDVIAIHNTNGSVVATLKDSYGNAVSGVNVKIVVGTLSNTAKTDANGQVSLDISSLEPGEYKISSRSGTTNVYNEARTTAKAFVFEDKINTTLTIPNVEVQYGDESAVVVATLKDVCGNILSGVKVKIVVGTLSKISRTDANGQVSMDISSLTPGEYKVSARSAVTDMYAEAKASAKVIVDKMTPALTIPNVFTLYNNDGVVVATLKDINGNILSGVKVKIVVGTLSKIARTDANGQISMDISSLAPGEYKISARTEITDLYNEAKATAKAIVTADKLNATLTIPDVEVYENTPASAVATLKDTKGNIISGVKVKIVVGTLSKIARTDENGQISIDISSLQPGQYKISARSAVTDVFNEAKATAKATVYAD